MIIYLQKFIIVQWFLTKLLSNGSYPNYCPMVVIFFKKNKEIGRHLCSILLAVPTQSNVQISSLQLRIRLIFSAHVL